MRNELIDYHEENVIIKYDWREKEASYRCKLIQEGDIFVKIELLPNRFHERSDDGIMYLNKSKILKINKLIGDNNGY